jgi:hypothetical protein
MSVFCEHGNTYFHIPSNILAGTVTIGFQQISCLMKFMDWLVGFFKNNTRTLS